MTAVHATPPQHTLPAVVRTTRELGWPHAPQADEMHDIAYAVTARVRTPARAFALVTTACYFGDTLRGTYCGIVVVSPHRRTQRYREDVRIREDGSYRIVRAHRGTKAASGI